MRVCLHILTKEAVDESQFTHADEGRCGLESVYTY